MLNALPYSTLGQLISSGIVAIDYEKLLESHYKKWLRPGDAVADIGAHTGRHLQHFLASVGDTGRVFAFEPLPDQYATLVKRFDVRHACLHNMALSNRSGTAQFTYAEGSPQESGLRQRIYNDPESARPRKIAVAVERLDAFAEQLKRLSFIKIDIEGAEMECLEGAQVVLDKYRPLISVEYGMQGYSVYGNTKWTLFEFCHARDYVLYDMFLNRLASPKAWGDAVDSVYWDYFMVPREKEETFLSRLRPQDTVRPRGYSLITSQSLTIAAAPALTLLQGFSSPEAWGYWTDGWHSSLRVTLPDPPRNDLLLVIEAHGYINAHHPHTEATVSVNGIEVGKLAFRFSDSTSDADIFEFTVPRHLCPANAAVIDFTIDQPCSPSQLGISEDPRHLGIGLHHIALYERLVAQV